MFVHTSRVYTYECRVFISVVTKLLHRVDSVCTVASFTSLSERFTSCLPSHYLHRLIFYSNSFNFDFTIRDRFIYSTAEKQTRIITNTPFSITSHEYQKKKMCQKKETALSRPNRFSRFSMFHPTDRPGNVR